MNVIISNDQNMVEIDGAKYEAINGLCINCELFKKNGICWKIPCDETERDDKRNVILKLTSP